MKIDKQDIDKLEKYTRAFFQETGLNYHDTWAKLKARALEDKKFKDLHTRLCWDFFWTVDKQFDMMFSTEWYSQGANDDNVFTAIKRWVKRLGLQ